MASEEVLKNRAIKKAKRRNVGFEVSVSLQLLVLKLILFLSCRVLPLLGAIRSINAFLKKKYLLCNLSRMPFKNI